MHSMTSAQAEHRLTDLAGQFAHWRQQRTYRFAPIPRPLWEQAIALTAVLPLGRVPAGCGYCFWTSPIPAVSSDSAGHEPSKLVFNPSLIPISLYLSIPSLSTPRSSTDLLF